MADTVVVRSATAADAPIIARHRAEMFSDMGQLAAGLYSDLVQQTIAYLQAALVRGEYLGWLASPPGQGDVIVAGAGVQRRRILPRPIAWTGDTRIARANEAIVLNVFTEKAWRRRGIAALLMREILAWASTADVDSLVLHTSDDGRALYEGLGFIRTNEMRCGRPLR